MAAASSGATNSFSHAQVGQKESLRFLILRADKERLRSMVISVVRIVVRVFIQSLAGPLAPGFAPVESVGKRVIAVAARRLESNL